MAAGDYAFGSLVLNDNVNYAVTLAHPPAVPIQVSRLPLAVRAGSAISYLRTQENIIPLEGLVKSTTFSDTESKLDTLLKNLYNGQQNLKIGYQDERYWKAYLADKPEIRKDGGLLYRYSAKLLAVDPLGYAAAAATPVTSASALTLVSGSEYSKSLAINGIGGNMPTFPLITINLSSGAYGITSIWVINTSISPNLRQTVSYAFVSSPPIIQGNLYLNGEAQTVQFGYFFLNTVDYSGQFLYLDPRVGANNTIEVHCTATSVPTFDVSVLWTPRWAA